jgi:hypothetical protein
MDKECAKAMSWALKGNHLKVYPVLYKKESYKPKGKKKVTLYKVKLVIEIGNAKHLGKEVYRQDDVTNKICEIYTHYYKQRKKIETLI